MLIRVRDIKVSCNISYPILCHGDKEQESFVVRPAPIWGDETNGNDISTDAWYNNGNSAQQADTLPGFYGPADNHGDKGGNFVFTDGHAEFLAGDIQETFFGDANTNDQSINLLDSTRSRRVQTID